MVTNIAYNSSPIRREQLTQLGMVSPSCLYWLVH